jgi:hypothetical protein
MDEMGNFRTGREENLVASRRMPLVATAAEAEASMLEVMVTMEGLEGLVRYR